MPPAPRPRAKTTAKPTPAATATTDATDSATSTPPLSRLAARTPADKRLHGSIETLYQGIGLGAIALAQARDDQRFLTVGVELLQGVPVQNVDGTVTQDAKAEKLADAWMDLADRNPKVKSVLKKFSEGAAASELIVLHVTLAMPFLPAIGALLPGRGNSGNGNGTPPPDMGAGGFP